MKLHFKKSKNRSADLLFVDKPSGFSTHSFANKDPNPGICEIFEAELKQKLFPLFPLQRLVSGAQCLVSSLEIQAELLEQKIEQVFWFVTDRVSTRASFVTSQGASTSTGIKFKRVKRSPFFELWSASTIAVGNQDSSETVRKEAASSGLNILGDAENGGSSFPHFCLHLQTLQIPGEEAFVVDGPRFFQRLGLLKDPELVSWISEIDRRQRLYNFLNCQKESLRLIHTESLRLDLFGPQIWFYWYKAEEPQEADLERVSFISQLLGKPFLLKKMQNRGVNPGEKFQWLHPDWKTEWTAQEFEQVFLFSSERGQSPGLFLDQRLNRSELRQISQQKTVLNLFAYTCGFSVVAALGGAEQVTSVDVSKTFLEWGKENFNLNGLAATKYEFFTQDALLFLKGCQKRARTFDLVICDPPSFGRNKDQIFKLDKDLKDLLLSTWQCLTAGGKILFSCNLEKWNLQETRSQIQKILPKAVIHPAPQAWDFEGPGISPLLKAFWVEKNPEKRQ